ncbi:MAG: transcription antitermination protein NusB [Phascolarctobacterium faecium]
MAINEAVEIAKIYGTDDTPRFINGVLGKMVRSDV